MTRELELSINSGRVYAGMSKIAKAKQELRDRLQEIYRDPKLSDEGKKEYKLLWRNKYEESRHYRYTAAYIIYKQETTKITSNLRFKC